MIVISTRPTADDRRIDAGPVGDPGADAGQLAVLAVDLEPVATHVHSFLPESRPSPAGAKILGSFGAPARALELVGERPFEHFEPPFHEVDDPPHFLGLGRIRLAGLARALLPGGRTIR